MKKQFLICLCAITCLSLFGGCGKKISSNAEEEKTSVSDSNLEKNFSDNTLQQKASSSDNALQSGVSLQELESNTVTFDNKNYKIYGTVDSEATLARLYDNVTEFNQSNSATNIVKGIVKSVTYEYLQHCPFSVITLEVQDNYKRELTGDIIIYEDGGYIPLDELADDVSGHGEFDVPSNELSEYVMDMKFMGADHVSVGDTLIAYLFPTSVPMAEGSYQYVSSVFGRYVLQGDTYQRTKFEVKDEDFATRNADNFESSISKDQFENILGEVRDNSQ